MSVYKSKVDIWIPLFIFSVLGVVEALMVINKLLVPSIIIGILILIVLQLFTGTAYIINDDKLIIKASVLYKKVIPVSSIRKLQATRDAIASPALSLDRIYIVHNNNEFIIVSPKNKRNFIAELKQLNPNIDVPNTSLQ